MKSLIPLIIGILLLSGCVAAPDASRAVSDTSATQPHEPVGPSSSAVQSVVAHRMAGDAVSDDQLLIYAQAVVYLDNAIPESLTVREICIEDSVLYVRFDSCSGVAESFRYHHSNIELVGSLHGYIIEISAALTDACKSMGRDELDGVALLMSDEDPEIPLMWAARGAIRYDSIIDDPAKSVFDPERYTRFLDIREALRAACSAYEPDCGDFYNLSVTSDECVCRFSAPLGTARGLGHRIDGAWDGLDGTAEQLMQLAQDMAAVAERYTGNTVSTSVYLLNDQDPGRVLLAVSSRSVLYDCRNELPDKSLTHEPAEYYVLNTSTKKIHNPWCVEVPNISTKNRKASMNDLQDLLLDGYTRCEQEGDWDVMEPTYPASVTIGLLRDELEGVTAP